MLAPLLFPCFIAYHSSSKIVIIPLALTKPNRKVIKTKFNNFALRFLKKRRIMWYLSINNLLHLISSVIWIGGLIYVVFVLFPSINNLQGLERAKVIGFALRRFSLIAWHCIALLLISGLIRAPHKLMFNITTQYGVILTIKHLFVILAIISFVLLSIHINKHFKPLLNDYQIELKKDYPQIELKLKFLYSANMIIGITILLIVFLFNFGF